MPSMFGAAVGFQPESIVHARLIALWGANLLSATSTSGPSYTRQRPGARSTNIGNQQGRAVLVAGPSAAWTAGTGDATAP
jgi:hypothetical protein